jgi:hypothetical protein
MVNNIGAVTFQDLVPAVVPKLNVKVAEGLADPVSI